MSGIIAGVNYSVLFAGTGDATTNLLATLYGAAGVGGASGGDPLSALTSAQKNETADLKAQAKDPTVARDIAAFQKGIAHAKTIQQALQNPDVLKVLLTANNLASQLPYPALAQKALMSNPADPKSLAVQLSSSNASWLAMAKTYNFAKNGLAELQKPSVQAALTSAYTEISWQTSLDATTPGLSNALQFIKQAHSITSVDQILGDPVNWAVVLTALGIPQQIAYQELPSQEAQVRSRLDVKKLQDPKFVTTLTDQYLLAMQQQSSTSGSGTSLDALATKASGLLV